MAFVIAITRASQHTVVIRTSNGGTNFDFFSRVVSDKARIDKDLVQLSIQSSGSGHNIQEGKVRCQEGQIVPVEVTSSDETMMGITRQNIVDSIAKRRAENIESRDRYSRRQI